MNITNIINSAQASKQINPVSDLKFNQKSDTVVNSDPSSFLYAMKAVGLQLFNPVKNNAGLDGTHFNKPIKSKSKSDYLGYFDSMEDDVDNMIKNVERMMEKKQ